MTISKDELRRAEEISGFVEASNYRTKVLEELSHEDMTPSNLANKLGTRIQYVSRALKELEEKELVKNLTPDARKGKIYRITHLGTLVKKILYDPQEIRKSTINSIVDTFIEHDIPSMQGMWFKTTTGIIRPTIVIPSQKQSRNPMIFIEVAFVGFFRQERKFTPILRYQLKDLAFDYMDLKKERPNLNLKVVVVIAGARRINLKEEANNEIVKFIQSGYFDGIFLEDEIDKLLAFVKNEIKNNSSIDLQFQREKYV